MPIQALLELYQRGAGVWIAPFSPFVPAPRLPPLKAGVLLDCGLDVIRKGITGRWLWDVPLLKDPGFCA